MGQYYTPVVLKNKENVTDSEQVLAWMYSHDYDNGLKLMEHSWVGNRFVNTFEKLLSPKGEFKKMRIVWAGDYADGESELSVYDEYGNETKTSLYDLCKDENKIKPKPAKTQYRYIFNHDTKEFVDKSKCPLSDVYTDDKGVDHPYYVHPLPLLTSEGNGRGGGDYRDKYGAKFVGKWARHRISVGNKILKGFTEIFPNFKEK